MSRTQCAEAGLTLVELVMFIVIVGLALAGVLLVLNTAVRSSADPMERKQALAIAESLLTEVAQQPFTWCDPNDAAAPTATSAAACANSQDKGGAPLTSPTPASESRYSAGDPFDNVADYGGFVMPGAGCAGICSQDGILFAALSGYSASVTVSRAGGSVGFAGMPLDAVLKIDVRVWKGSTDITLTGYRTRHAPNI
jgi:MSHA pilin protein MshD